MEIILQPYQTVTFYHGEASNEYDVQITNSELDSIIKIKYEKMEHLNLYSCHYILNGLIVHIYFTRFEVRNL